MKLQCKQCGAQIPAVDMNLKNLVARCRACDSVFSFANVIGTALGTGPDREVRPQGDVPMPKAITVDDLSGKLSITRRWFSAAAIALVVFCAFWDGFLFFWYFAAFKEGAPLAMKLFPVLHLAVGALLTYLMLASLINRTTIEVDGPEMTIRHAPIPWPGNRTLLCTDIEQLFTREKVHRGKHGIHHTYELWVREKNGGSTKLLSGIQSSEQVLFLEQAIEKHLKIVDRAVAGEMGQ